MDFTVTSAGGTFTTELLTIQIPAGAVTETITLHYIPLPPPDLPEIVRPLIHFKLEAENEKDEPVTHFLQPITIIYHYSDIEIQGIIESTLQMYWQNTTIGGFYPLSGDTNPATNTITISLDHLSSFMTLGQVEPPPGEMDSDEDGLYDSQEAVLGTDPNDSDSDDDSLSDYLEVIVFLTDPLQQDGDGDGIKDLDELETYGSNPNLVDSDGDTISDFDETMAGTDPNKADTDNDGIDDNLEFINGTDPLDPDSDDDGLLDGEEIVPGVDGYITYPYCFRF